MKNKGFNFKKEIVKLLSNYVSGYYEREVKVVYNDKVYHMRFVEEKIEEFASGGKYKLGLLLSYQGSIFEYTIIEKQYLIESHGIKEEKVNLRNRFINEIKKEFEKIEKIIDMNLRGFIVLV